MLRINTKPRPLDPRHPPHPSDDLDSIAATILSVAAVFIGATGVFGTLLALGWL